MIGQIATASGAIVQVAGNGSVGLDIDIFTQRSQDRIPGHGMARLSKSEALELLIHVERALGLAQGAAA